VERKCLTAVLMMVCGFISVGAQGPNEIQTHGKVCPNPSAPCQPAKWKNQIVMFGSQDLSFHLPPHLKWLSNYYSASFYAVILNSKKAVPDPDGPAGPAQCSGYFSERERLEAQSVFPNQKVFASRFGCGSPGVGYTNVNYNFNFLAVYAGETQAAANSFLAQVKATGKFPGPNIRKMQVVLDYGD
jgi:hypothetical protein